MLAPASPTSRNNQFKKYDDYLHEMHLKGIVDPHEVFTYLFTQYCSPGLNPITYFSRKHSNFLKARKITSLAALLDHLNDYCGKHHLDEQEGFYRLCLVFFHHYGHPGVTYNNLRYFKDKVTCYQNKQILDLQESFCNQLTIDNYPAELEVFFALNMPEDFIDKVLLAIHKIIQIQAHLLGESAYGKIGSALNQVIPTDCKDKISDKLFNIHKQNKGCFCPIHKHFLRDTRKDNQSHESDQGSSKFITALLDEFVHHSLDYRVASTIIIPEKFNEAILKKIEFRQWKQRIYNYPAILILLSRLPNTENIRTQYINDIFENIEEHFKSCKVSCFIELKAFIPIPLQEEFINKIRLVCTKWLSQNCDNFNLLKQLARYSPYDEEVQILLTNKLLQLLDNKEIARDVFFILEEVIVPPSLQQTVIEKLFSLLENSNNYFDDCMKVIRVFEHHIYQPHLQVIIVEKLISIIEKRHYMGRIHNNILETLSMLNFAHYPVERIIECILPLLPENASACKIMKEVIIIPQVQQYAVIQKLMSSLTIHSLETMVAIFPKLAINQQILLLSNLEKEVITKQNTRAILLYCRLRMISRLNPVTTLEQLPNIPDCVIEAETAKLVRVFNIQGQDENVIKITTTPLAKKYTRITSYALWLAVKYNRTKLVEILLTQDININGIFHENTPLSLACSLGYTVLAQMLVAHGANHHLFNPLKKAVEVENLTLIKLLLSLIPKIEIADTFHLACSKNKVGLIEPFIKTNININHYDSDGKHPIESWMRVYYRPITEKENVCIDYSVLEKVLKAGGWSKKACKDAVMISWVGCLERLLKFMPSEMMPEFPNELLKECKDPAIAELLIKVGGDITLIPLRGIIASTSLTTQYCEIATKDQIIKKQEEELEPLFYDKEARDINILNLIILHERLPFGVNYKNKSGKTLLHLICGCLFLKNETGLSFAAFLLKKGADLFIKDHQGRLPHDCIQTNYVSADTRLAAEKGKSRWFDTFDRNYQEQRFLQTIFILMQGHLKQPPCSPFAKLPMDIVIYILNFVSAEIPHRDSTKVSSKIIGIKQSIFSLIEKKATSPTLQSTVVVNDLKISQR